MADDASPSEAAGQAEGGSEGTTAAASEGSKGQAGASAGKGSGEGTTGQDSSAEESFFDPSEVPEGLQKAYKSMQRAFTKKMQGLSQEKSKAQWYDEFAKDPVAGVQKIASQYGMSLTKGQAQQLANQQAPGSQDPAQWQPQTWPEVINKAKQEAVQEVLTQLRPLLGEVQAIKKQSIEKQLSEIDPTWQQYEDVMIEKLRRHPSLATDPAELYRISVPQEVIESRATQRALQKFEAKAKSQSASGGSTTSKRQSAPDTDQRFSSVADAAAFARRQLEEKGIRLSR